MLEGCWAKLYKCSIASSNGYSLALWMFGYLGSLEATLICRGLLNMSKLVILPYPWLGGGEGRGRA